MRDCPCTGKHVPKPVALVEVDRDLWLCPTSAVNFQRLLVEYDTHRGVPPGSVTKHYSAFIRALALTHWPVLR